MRSTSTKNVNAHVPGDLILRARLAALERGIPYRQVIEEALDAGLPRRRIAAVELGETSPSRRGLKS